MQVGLVAVFVAAIQVLHVLLRPRSLRAKLEKQGIHGPSPHFFFGNIPEMKTLSLQQKTTQAQGTDKDDDVSASVSHGWHSTLYPHFDKWRKQYGN